LLTNPLVRKLPECVVFIGGDTNKDVSTLSQTIIDRNLDKKLIESE